MSDQKNLEDALLDYLTTEMRVTLSTTDDLHVAGGWINRLDGMLERVAGMRLEARERLARLLRHNDPKENAR
jgi:hypothetical protein